MNSYLRFVERISPSGKTLVVSVESRRHGDVLGEIKWFGRWRQYALYPSAGTIWNPDCLDEISAEIRRMMQERFEARRLPA